MKVIIKGKTLKGSPAFMRQNLMPLKLPWGEVKIVRDSILEKINISTEEEKNNFLLSLEKEQLNYTIKGFSGRKRGAYTNLVYKTPLKGGNFRVTSTVIRLGLDYSKMKKLDKSDLSVRSLPWGTWDKEYPLYIINHKGNKYLRCYLTMNKRHKKKESYYNQDLQNIESTEELRRENKGHPDKTFTVKLENILFLNEE